MVQDMTLDSLSDDKTKAKVEEAGNAIDNAITNPQPKRSVADTPDFLSTTAANGKSRRRTAIKSGFKPDGVCEEPECSEPSTIELRYHRHGSRVNSASLFPALLNSCFSAAVASFTYASRFAAASRLASSA